MDKIVINPNGVCSRKIEISVEDNIIKEVVFTGGCAGNTKGVASLLVGMSVEEAVSRLEGIRCGFRSTSCPNELATGLKKYYQKNG